MATKAGDATGDAPEGGPGASAAEHADIAGMSYEQARDELVEIVARLEGGQVALQESMDLWLRAEVLAAHCSTWLDRAEARISAQG